MVVRNVAKAHDRRYDHIVAADTTPLIDNNLSNASVGGASHDRCSVQFRDKGAAIHGCPYLGVSELTFGKDTLEKLVPLRVIGQLCADEVDQFIENVMW